MSKHQFLALITAGCVGLVDQAGAHVGNRLFSFYELTDEDLARIDLHDGSADDWRDVVGEPSLTASEFYIGAGGDAPPYDPSDLDFRIWLGWHQEPARIYVAMECSDNAYVNYYEGMRISNNIMIDNDSMEFMIDGDHSGGEYTFTPEDFSTANEFIQVSQTQAQLYYALARTPDARYVNLILLDGWYTLPPYVDGGGGIFGEAPTISVLEFYVTPFDRLVKDSPEQAVISALFPGKVIGFFMEIVDYDRLPKEVHGAYAVYPSIRTLFTADGFVDGLLVGAGGAAPEISAVAQDSWGRIKASFGR